MSYFLLYLVSIVSYFSSLLVFLLWDDFKNISFTVGEDGLFLFLFFICCNFALCMCFLSWLLPSLLWSAVLKSPFNYLSLLRS